MYAVYAMAAAVVLGLVIGTVRVLPFGWLPRGRRERYTIGGAVAFAWSVLRLILFVRDEVHGELDLADDEGAVVVCNHRSWLDPVLLMLHLRSNGLSKREIFWIPFVGIYGHLSGAVFFDRRDPAERARARREVMTLVRAGMRIQVFPEGTRSRDGRLRERVYLTLPHDCFDAGVPVVCCAVEGTERVLPPGEFAAVPGQACALHLGPTLRPADFDDADTFARACWDAVVALVEDARSGGRTRTPQGGRGF